MRNSTVTFIYSLGVLVFVLSASSCKKEESVKATITVLHDVNELVGTDTAGDAIYDTVESPLLGAEVRLRSTVAGSIIGDTLVTGASGVANFEFDNPAILELEIVYVDDTYEIGSITLSEAGDNVERTVNIDNW